MADLNVDITNGQQQNVAITLPDTQRVSTVTQPTQTVTVLDKYSIVGLRLCRQALYICAILTLGIVGRNA